METTHTSPCIYQTPDQWSVHNTSFCPLCREKALEGGWSAEDLDEWEKEVGGPGLQSEET